MNDHQPYLLFAFLDPEEQESMKERGEGDPLALSAMEESIDLHAALRKGGDLTTRGQDDLFLALTAASGQGAVWHHAAVRRIESDPRLAEKWALFQSRSRLLDHESDPEAHFRRLSDSPSSRGHGRVWLAAATVVLLVLAHGGYSALTEDRVVRMAWVDMNPVGPTRSEVPAAGDLQEARQAAFSARRSLLGLWPRYDQSALTKAEQLLSAREDPAALLDRARIQVILRRPAVALELLSQVPVAGPAGAEASRLRSLLER